MKKKSVKLIAEIVAGIAIAVSFAFGWEIQNVENPAEAFRILADSFTLPGIFFAGIATMVWISTKGGYDGLTFCVTYVIRSFNPNANLTESYYDYKQRKNEKRLKSDLCLLWVGLGLLAVALLFTVLYNVYYVPEA